MRLEGRVVVVTGATTSIGEAMAHAFVDEGARVVRSDTSEPGDGGDSTGDDPGEAVSVATDLRDPDDVERLLATARDTYGPVDVFVDNAALPRGPAGEDERRRVDEQPVAEWDDVVETTVRGAFLCSRAVLPGMRERGQGRLIHATTGLGRHGRPGWGPRVASTHAIEGLHKTIAVECEGSGVSAVLLRTPRGGVHPDPADGGGTFEPAVLAEPAVQLAAGAGDNGGYYIATEDGESFVSHDDTDLWPLVDTRQQVGPGDTLSWSVDLQAGDELVIDARLIEGTAPVVEVRDAGEASLAVVDGIGIGEQVRQQVEAEADGRHHVHFRNEAPLASGQWDIRISLRDAKTAS